MKKTIALILSVFLVLTLFVACGKRNEPEPSKELSTAANGETQPVSDGEHPQVEVTMENGKSFVIELYPEYAPKTVENFLELVKSGFYDGLTFHRVVAGFMAQGGQQKDSDDAEYKTIKGEFSANGFDSNELSHTRGVVSMARAEDNDSASTQFFICYGDCTFLDGQYAAFGKVIKGMETVDSFAEGEMSVNSLGESATPVEPIYIKSMKVL